MDNYTRDPNRDSPVPIRLPLVGVPNQRGEDPSTDSRLVNGYIEAGQDEVMRIVKRPGVSVARTLAGYGAGMLGDYSFFYAPIEGGVSGKLYDGDILVATMGAYATSLPPLRFFSSDYALTSLTTATAFFQDGFSAWTYDATAGLRAIPFAGTPLGPLTCGISLGLPTVTTASTELIRKYSGVSGTGVPANTSVLSVDSAVQFTMDANASATNAAAALTFNTAGPAAVPATGSAFPGGGSGQRLTAGVAHVNNSVYVYSMTSVISGADILDPYSWEPLNFISAYANIDNARAIFKNLSYIIALKSASTEFFRDVGNSPGSPLERLEGLRLDIGCLVPRSVTSIDGVLLWVSTTESGLVSVYKMERAKSDEVATPAIKRVLAGLNIKYGISLSISGHSFYVITDPDAEISLVYDITSNYWSYWDALGETYFPFVAAVAASDATGDTFLQHESDGKIYRMSPSLSTDAGANFDMDIYPPQFDGAMRIAKYLARMYVLADQEPGSTLFVRTSDDDQLTRTWTNFRPIDLGMSRPDLYDLGSFTKRWFHFRHSAATPCRVTSVELELLACTL